MSGSAVNDEGAARDRSPGDELEAMTEDIRLGPTTGVNRSDEDGSFSENVFDDDSTVGFQ